MRTKPGVLRPMYIPSRKSATRTMVLGSWTKERMKDVSKNGTGKDLNDLDGGCGVKTGTAQSTINNVKVNHSWITGFYPEDNPKYVITVLVEGNESGNKSSIPLFREICIKINNKK